MGNLKLAERYAMQCDTRPLRMTQYGRGGTNSDFRMLMNYCKVMKLYQIDTQGSKYAKRFDEAFGN